MPQSMQQKREGSLSRLKESLKINVRNLSEVPPSSGDSKQVDLMRESRRERWASSIVNIKRMIEQTEAAIQRNR